MFTKQSDVLKDEWLPPSSVPLGVKANMWARNVPGKGHAMDDVLREWGEEGWTLVSVQEVLLSGTSTNIYNLWFAK